MLDDSFVSRALGETIRQRTSDGNRGAVPCIHRLVGHLVATAALGEERQEPTIVILSHGELGEAA